MKITDYRGWKLLLDDRPSFTICPPDGEALISDRVFCSPEIAEAEGKCFVDKAILKAQIRSELDEYLEAHLIPMDLYQRMNTIIAQMARITASDHLEFEQKLHRQQPENPRGSLP